MISNPNPLLFHSVARVCSSVAPTIPQPPLIAWASLLYAASSLPDAATRIRRNPFSRHPPGTSHKAAQAEDRFIDAASFAYTPSFRMQSPSSHPRPTPPPHLRQVLRQTVSIVKGFSRNPSNPRSSRLLRLAPTHSQQRRPIPTNLAQPPSQLSPAIPGICISTSTTSGFEPIAAARDSNAASPESAVVTA